MRLLKTALKIGAPCVALLLLAALGWAWWAYPKRAVDGVFVRRAPFTFADVPKGRPLDAAAVDGYARRLLAEMTLDEKVLMMSGDTWLWDFVGQPAVGRPWSAGVDRRLGLPPLVFTDGPRGVGLGSSTCFPVPMARAASWDRAVENRVGDLAGREARGHGANVWLAPCLNLLRHPRWGRAQETYGEDPYLVGEMAAALVDGAQRNNVMACAKHLAMNSIEETRHTVDVRVDERVLREVYLPHFKRVVDAGVATVMSAYNKVDGDYCGENRHLLHEILKGEWGFPGFVMSDWFDGAYDGVKAANAGLDLEMPMAIVYGPKLAAAVRDGRVAEAAVDEAVLRILRRRIEYAVRPDPMTYDARLVRAPEHVAFAREAAEKSLVLLKNDGVLPLDRGRLKALAVVGPLADAENIGDRGSSRVRPKQIETIVAGLRDAAGAGVSVVHEPDPAKAAEAARRADAAVVVVGFGYSDEGEYIPVALIDKREWGGDRKTLALKPADQALVRAVSAANPRTIVVLIGGAAITVEEWQAGAAAIVMAFYPGEQGGVAVARTLFGDVNPSGKLPFTVPKDASQLPPFDNVSTSVAYGPYHGYTLLDRNGVAPRYAFGYGLSYTKYAYARLTLDASAIAEGATIGATVDVTNVGERSGEEVVELYVGFPQTPVERPLKLLRGFEKVALAPHETKRVAFTLAARDLAYYDVEAQAWRVATGAYRALVGPSSRDADLLSAGFEVR